jgi:hypothetical protein
MTKLFSHTSYAMQTNHHHHTYESPKQYYSTQLSHTFNNDNIVLPCTKIITANTLKKFFMSLICDGQAHTYETFPAICFVQNTPTEPHQLQVTPLWPLVAPQSLFPGFHLSFTRVLTRMTVPNPCAALSHAHSARHYKEPSLNSSSCEEDLHVQIPTNNYCQSVARLWHLYSVLPESSTMSLSFEIQQQV